MTCELKEDGDQTIAGLTLFSKPGTCKRPTGVYLPPKHSDASNMLNVVIWLHGFYVETPRKLFYGDPAKIREQVRDSQKDVVLIAPWLGDGEKGQKNAEYNGSRTAMGKGNWGEYYLDEVLEALAQFLRKRNPASPATLDIKNLVVACHSGGGEAMRNLVAGGGEAGGDLVGTLGKYRPRLKECWGFDCLYHAALPNDDATKWFTWRLLGKDARPLYIFYGPSTLPQSVKLDLVARGKATFEGDRANPPRPPVGDVFVIPAHHESFPMAGQMVHVSDYISSDVDDLMDRAPAKGTSPKNYVEQAIDNLKKMYIFPVFDDMELHYFIAKAFFLSRLRKATFF
jgi:hypothetical protein